MSEVPPELLAQRRRTGADRYDEVWGGVLHMAPVPSTDHQRLRDRLLVWLATHWADPPQRDVMSEVNIAPPGCANWTRNFRIPDLMLITEDSPHIDRGTHFEGAPDVVVEIRSPGDETDDKLPFYAEAGCREIWVIDRDTRACTIHTVTDGALHAGNPDATGWLRSDLGVELRSDLGHLRLRLSGDDSPGHPLP